MLEGGFEEREAKKKRKIISAEDGWIDINPVREKLVLKPQPIPEHQFPVFTLREGTRMITILTSFIDIPFAEYMISCVPRERWMMHHAGRSPTSKWSAHWINPTVGDLYRAYAVYIRIQGLQNVPKESDPKKRPRRDAIKEALASFNAKFGYVDFTYTKVERYLQNCKISEKFYDILSERFRSIIRSLGAWVSGDEKLLKYYGNSGDIRKVMSKPDKIGLWFYELCILLKRNSRLTGAYLVDMKLHSVEKSRDETQTTIDIGRRWAAIVEDKGAKDANCDHYKATILTMDSYYGTQGLAKELDDREVFNMMSCTADRFPGMYKALHKGIERPGDVHIAHKPVGYHGLTRVATFKWDKDPAIGKKLCLTNAFKVIIGKEKITKHKAYDAYKNTFQACDIFNRNLHDKKFPFRNGGGGIPGDIGHQHNFAMSCLLQNVISAYFEINNFHDDLYHYKNLCCELADEIWQLANSIN